MRRPQDVLQHYRQQALEFATPGELLVRLLDAAVMNCEQARAFTVKKDPAGKGLHIGRAIAILGELEATLRHDAAPELSSRLASLYQFARERLLQASILMEVSGIDEALRAISPVRDAYAQIVRNGEGAAPAAGGEVPQE